MDEHSPIRDLYNEHNGITIILEILHTIAIELRRGKSINTSDLGSIVKFLSVFADQCHHGKEEGILIPDMKKIGRSDTKLISEIIGEHKTGRDLIGGMRNALEHTPDKPEFFHFAANADAYVAMLTDHIRKENVILFPQAEAILGAKQKLLMADKFVTLEEHVIGKGVHEEFRKLLKTLQKKYLS